MTKHFNIDHNTVHLWRLFLPDFTQEISSLSQLLNHHEEERAKRFHFPQHQERYRITHGLLRKTLSLYTGIDPKALTFQYGEHGKPYLANTDSELKFNISHSHDMAIFAFTIQHEIGVDIEKVETSFKESVGKRFFSPDEYAELMQLPDTERVNAFYKMWCRKEALIKLLGKGLYTRLDSFTVSSQNDSQSVLCHENRYLVKNIDINPEYQAAFATLEPVVQVIEVDWWARR